MTLRWSILASMNWKYNPFLYSHFSVWTLDIQMQVSNRLDSQSVRYTYQNPWCKYELLFLKRVSLRWMSKDEWVLLRNSLQENSFVFFSAFQISNIYFQQNSKSNAKQSKLQSTLLQRHLAALIKKDQTC